MPRFCVSYIMHGRATEILEADSAEDLQRRLDSRSDDQFPDPDEIDDLDFEIREMSIVKENGRELWTTHRSA